MENSLSIEEKGLLSALGIVNNERFNSGGAADNLLHF